MIQGRKLESGGRVREDGNEHSGRADRVCVCGGGCFDGFCVRGGFIFEVGVTWED